MKKGLLRAISTSAFLCILAPNSAKAQGLVFCTADQSEFYTDCLGLYQWSDGSKYFGNWEGNKRNGFGVWSNIFGDYFVGEYRSDLRVGSGLYFWSTGAIDWCAYDAHGKPQECIKFNLSNIFTESAEIFRSLPDDLRRVVQKGLADFPVVSSDVDGIWGRKTLISFIFLYSIQNKKLLPPPDDNGLYARSALAFLKSKLDEQSGGQWNSPLPVGSGSAFFVTAAGHLVSNNHVVDGCATLKVSFDGLLHEVITLARDKVNDLALLKVEIEPPYFFKISQRNPMLLQEIIVAGFPFGDAFSSNVKVTKGIVSSLSGIGDNYSLMQIDAAMQPGNSGGPVVDTSGDVVGVAVSKLGFRKVFQELNTIPENVNFAIKSSVIRNFLDSEGVALDASDKADVDIAVMGRNIVAGTVQISCYDY